MTDKEPATKTHGYIDVDAIKHTSEWKKYSAATTLTEQTRTKEAVRQLLKPGLDLPDDARIDFMKVGDRIKVIELLHPPKASKRRGTDLSHLFKKG